ncbi:MAG TPA: hypothetical protein VME23_12215 [Terracidiphilus sp.]|nr:hypothetical protein [Terracidiphilus sp.]
MRASLLPGDPDTTLRANFIGDDDHPAYSDAQISEAVVADSNDEQRRSITELLPARLVGAEVVMN